MSAVGRQVETTKWESAGEIETMALEDEGEDDDEG